MGVIVQDIGDVGTLAERQQLAVSVSSAALQASARTRTAVWSAEIGVGCTGLYCNYARGNTLGQAVDVRGDRRLVAETPQCRPEVVDGNHQHVWLRLAKREDRPENPKQQH